MNGTMLQSFEWNTPSDGRFWKKVAAHAAGLRRLGVTAVWLPPACKGHAGTDDVGYGVYDLYDLGEFDQKGTVRTRYGTKEEYLGCVRALKQNGIQAIADIVLGQRFGADEAETVELHPVWKNDRNAVAGEPFTAKVMTRFTFPGRNGKWSDFVWDSRSLSAVDWYEGCGDMDRVYLLGGKRFSADVDTEFGNYDFLMGCDMDASDPAVRTELKRWGAWFLTETGADGFRLDAVKHISASFYREWLKDLRLFSGKELFTVGEYWHGDVHTLTRYLEAQDFGMSLFDVPLHLHFHEASVAKENYDLRDLYRDTLSYCRPTQAVTFVDNHDTQPGQSLQSWVEPWFKPAAYALILLRGVGYPCVFTGDLYGLAQPKTARMKLLPRLMRLRAENALGEEHTAFDDPGCIGFTREGLPEDRKTGLAVLISAGSGGEKRMFAGKHHTGETWKCVTGNGCAVTIDPDGCGVFRMKKGALAVWTPPKGLFARLADRLRHKRQDKINKED